jgi:hypothetical protein
LVRTERRRGYGRFWDKAGSERDFFWTEQFLEPLALDLRKALNLVTAFGSRGGISGDGITQRLSARNAWICPFRGRWACRSRFQPAAMVSVGTIQERWSPGIRMIPRRLSSRFRLAAVASVGQCPHPRYPATFRSHATFLAHQIFNPRTYGFRFFTHRIELFDEFSRTV